MSQGRKSFSNSMTAGTQKLRNQISRTGILRMKFVDGGISSGIDCPILPLRCLTNPIHLLTSIRNGNCQVQVCPIRDDPVGRLERDSTKNFQLMRSLSLHE